MIIVVQSSEIHSGVVRLCSRSGVQPDTVFLPVSGVELLQQRFAMHAQGSEVRKEGEGPSKENGGVAPLVPGDVIAKLMDKPGGQTCELCCCSHHNGASCISQEFRRHHWLLGAMLRLLSWVYAYQCTHTHHSIPMTAVLNEWVYRMLLYAYA